MFTLPPIVLGSPREGTAHDQHDGCHGTTVCYPSLRASSEGGQ
jgi:hypothetical protein